MRRYLRRVAELQLETGSDCFREIEMHFTLVKWREERSFVRTDDARAPNPITRYAAFESRSNMRGIRLIARASCLRSHKNT